MKNKKGFDELKTPIVFLPHDDHCGCLDCGKGATKKAPVADAATMQSKIEQRIERYNMDIEDTMRQIDEYGVAAVRDIQRALLAVKTGLRSETTIGGESTVRSNAVKLGDALEFLQALHDRKNELKSILNGKVA